jgi:hypothetical protein
MSYRAIFVLQAWYIYRDRVVARQLDFAMKRVVQSALCIIPPEDLWEPIQHIRRERDKAFPRWMPHINLLYPFYPEAAFEVGFHATHLAQTSPGSSSCYLVCA